MASQLHGGCGFKWQQDFNELAIVDHEHVDGLLVQWYQGACSNLGHCPKATCGKELTPNCFDMNFSTTILNMFESPGACASNPPSIDQNGKWFANCSAVLDSCKVFPLEKIAIGVGTYYQVSQMEGLITSQNILDLDDTVSRRLQGAGSWDINFGLDDERTANFYLDLANAW